MRGRIDLALERVHGGVGALSHPRVLKEGIMHKKNPRGEKISSLFRQHRGGESSYNILCSSPRLIASLNIESAERQKKREGSLFIRYCANRAQRRGINS